MLAFCINVTDRDVSHSAEWGGWFSRIDFSEENLHEDNWQCSVRVFVRVINEYGENDAMVWGRDGPRNTPWRVRADGGLINCRNYRSGCVCVGGGKGMVAYLSG